MGRTKLVARIFATHSTFVSFCALGEGTKGFAVKREHRSPKPAFLLPENFKAYVSLIVIVAQKVEALIASCH